MSDFAASASLSNLADRRAGRTRRVSSWDTTGGNRDYLTIAAGQTATLVEIEGCGVIRHIWITVGHKDRLYLRKMVLRAYWDGESVPSVQAPLGDFFCLGHGVARSFQNAAFNAVTHEENEGNVGGGVALNCYFAMPFAEGMRVTIENESDQECGSFYYYVDYDELPSLPKDTLRFHAQYLQEHPTTVEGGTLAQRGEHCWEHMKDPNIGGEGNYVILSADGAGHFVGCNLSVENIDPMLAKRRFGNIEMAVPELTWWGEGDDMIFIDDDTWPPSLHGTGSEDYLTQAWGMHDKAYLYGGTSVNEFDKRHPDRRACTSYRLHVLDPVLFEKRIRVTIEHGHANLQQNNFSSVAYWYQTKPHTPFAPLPPAEERIPLFAKDGE